jgi:hypothetical protein
MGKNRRGAHYNEGAMQAMRNKEGAPTYTCASRIDAGEVWVA